MMFDGARPIFVTSICRILLVQSGSKSILTYNANSHSPHPQAAYSIESPMEGTDGDVQDDALVALRPLQVGLRSSAGSLAVQACNAADYLALKRQYKGLETPLTGAAHKKAEMAVEGRAGRAAGYSDEPRHQEPQGT